MQQRLVGPSDKAPRRRAGRQMEASDGTVSGVQLTQCVRTAGKADVEVQPGRVCSVLPSSAKALSWLALSMRMLAEESKAIANARSRSKCSAAICGASRACTCRSAHNNLSAKSAGPADPGPRRSGRIRVFSSHRLSCPRRVGTKNRAHAQRPRWNRGRAPPPTYPSTDCGSVLRARPLASAYDSSTLCTPRVCRKASPSARRHICSNVRRGTVGPGRPEPRTVAYDSRLLWTRSPRRPPLRFIRSPRSTRRCCPWSVVLSRSARAHACSRSASARLPAPGSASPASPTRRRARGAQHAARAALGRRRPPRLPAAVAPVRWASSGGCFPSRRWCWRRRILVAPIVTALTRQAIEDADRAHGEQLTSLGAAPFMRGLLLAWTNATRC